MCTVPTCGSARGPVSGPARSPLEQARLCPPLPSPPRVTPCSRRARLLCAVCGGHGRLLVAAHKPQFSCAPDAAALLASGLLDDRRGSVFRHILHASRTHGSASGPGTANITATDVGDDRRGVSRAAPVGFAPRQAAHRLGVALAHGDTMPAGAAGGGTSGQPFPYHRAPLDVDASRRMDETVCTVVDSLEFIVRRALCGPTKRARQPPPAPKPTRAGYVCRCLTRLVMACCHVFACTCDA